MKIEYILTIVFGVLFIAGTLVSYYFLIKGKIMRQINGEINKAEDLDVDGEKKMAEVVLQLKQMVPVILRPFITDALLESLVQVAFDGIKAFATKQAKKDATKKK